MKWGPDSRLRPSGLGGPAFRAALVEALDERHSGELLRRQLLQTNQDASLEKYTGRFTGLCLSASQLDQLTKATLYIEGLASTEMKKETRQEHASTRAEAVSAARTAQDSLCPQRNFRRGEVASELEFPSMRGMRSRVDRYGGLRDND